MEIYKLDRKKDGSVVVETMLTNEEVKFMLEFALANLLAMGMLPKSVAAYIDTHKDEFEEARQKALLESISKDDMHEG